MQLKEASFLMRHVSKKEKRAHILFFVAMVPGILLFVLERDATSVTVCMLCAWVIMVFAVWNWNEDSPTVNKLALVAVVTVAAVTLTVISWPKNPLAEELCPHPLRFTVKQRGDSAVDIVIHKRWLGKPIWSVALFAKRMPQMAKAVTPATATVAGQGWQQSAYMEFVNSSPVSEWDISVPSDPSLICVNGVPYN